MGILESGYFLDECGWYVKYMAGLGIAEERMIEDRLYAAQPDECTY